MLMYSLELHENSWFIS